MTKKTRNRLATFYVLLAVASAWVFDKVPNLKTPAVVLIILLVVAILATPMENECND